jgi:hypothetical protein
MSDGRARTFWIVVSAILGIAAVIALFALSPTAREVAKDTGVILFTIFTTPFIFETTIAVCGLLILLFVNQWRLKKEGDGWVYLVTQESDAGTAKLPASITQRLQSLVLNEKPEAVDEAGTMRAKIEGFLELGMAAQAAEALTESGQLADDEITGALRIRVLAANLDTDNARKLLRDSVDRYPERRLLFAQTAVDCADWLEAHAPRQLDAIQIWREEMQRITGHHLGA